MERVKFSVFFKNFDKIHMDISEIERIRLGSEWKENNVCSIFTRIYMIEDGYAEVYCDGKTIPLLPGNIYIIPAGLTFSYSCQEYMKKIYFHISVLLPNHQDIFTSCSKCVILENKQAQIEMIRQNLSENKPGSIMAVKAFLYQLVLQCIQKEESMNQEITNYSEIIYKTQEYIEANLSAKLTVTQIAEALFLSPSKLQKLFKKEIGISVGRYIDERLMYIAEREVRRGEYSINELSTMLGFCDQFYFSRRFSETYGMPPLRYRKFFAL